MESEFLKGVRVEGEVVDYREGMGYRVYIDELSGYMNIPESLFPPAHTVALKDKIELTAVLVAAVAKKIPGIPAAPPNRLSGVVSAIHKDAIEIELDAATAQKYCFDRPRVFYDRADLGSYFNRLLNIKYIRQGVEVKFQVVHQGNRRHLRQFTLQHCPSEIESNAWQAAQKLIAEVQRGVRTHRLKVEITGPFILEVGFPISFLSMPKRQEVGNAWILNESEIQGIIDFISH